MTVARHWCTAFDPKVGSHYRCRNGDYIAGVPRCNVPDQLVSWEVCSALLCSALLCTELISIGALSGIHPASLDDK